MTIDEYTQFLVTKDKLVILMQAFYSRYVVLHGEQPITFDTYVAEPHGVTVRWKKDGVEGHFDVPLATLLNRNRWDEWILPRVVAAGQDKAATSVAQQEGDGDGEAQCVS